MQMCICGCSGSRGAVGLGEERESLAKAGVVERRRLAQLGRTAETVPQQRPVKDFPWVFTRCDLGLLELLLLGSYVRGEIGGAPGITPTVRRAPQV